MTVVAWLKLPEVAVIVAVYVPAGVPDVVCEGELPPPQPTQKDAPRMTVSAALTDCGRLRRTSRSPDTSRSSEYISIGARGNFTSASVPVPPAVVFTVTVSEAGVPAVTFIELGILHVGAEVGAGEILQLRFTVPLNDPDGVIDKLNLAFSPGLTVCDVCCPDAGLIAKSFGAVAVPSRVAV